MSLILLIDTSNENAFVCLINKGALMAIKTNTEQNQHASFIQIAIMELCNNTSVKLKDIVAVAVVNGPGSYTGLRVGLATAKGICYSLNKPLILINTLYLMAAALRTNYLKNNDNLLPVLLCPLIDARRMEVFTAIYDLELTEVMTNVNLIVDEYSFNTYIINHSVVFGGSGSIKVEKTLKQQNCFYFDKLDYTNEACIKATELFNFGHFESLIYSEPYYLKAFYNNK